MQQRLFCLTVLRFSASIAFRDYSQQTHCRAGICQQGHLVLWAGFQRPACGTPTKLNGDKKCQK